MFYKMFYGRWVWGYCLQRSRLNEWKKIIYLLSNSGKWRVSAAFLGQTIYEKIFEATCCRHSDSPHCVPGVAMAP